MTCLVPPAAPLSAGQPDDSCDRQIGSSSDSREHSLDLVGAAFQGLLDQWRGLGLDLDVWLPIPQALPRLSAWSERQLEQLHQVLTSLQQDPQACRELASGLESLAMGIGSVNFASWSEKLLWLRPLLSLQGLTRQGTDSRLYWPQLPGDPLSVPLEQLGLTIRSLNRMRRHGWTRLADLAGIDAQGLLALRGMGGASLQEIADLLEKQGLGLPFNLEDGLSLPPLAGMTQGSAGTAFDRADPIQQTFAATTSKHGLRPADAADAHDWSARAIALLTSQDDGRRPDRALQALQSLTIERYPSLRQRLEEIHQLRELLRSVEVAAGLMEGEVAILNVGMKAVQQRVLERYSGLIASAEATATWLTTLQRHLFKNPHCLQMLLMQLSGRSIAAIGQSMRPPLSRDRVRQQIQVLERLLYVKVERLREVCQEHLTTRETVSKAEVLRNWIAIHGRMPFHTDDDSLESAETTAGSEICQQVRNLSLNRRLALHEELGLPVPEAEWDLHLRVLTDRAERPGTGYWDSLEPLRQYLPRFAALIGSPGVMPHQTELPPAVRAAVQRHGGQCSVAGAIGLAYKNQLVGEHGRAYWTELRLEQLLEQTVAYCQLPLRSMPSRLQIRDFMTSNLVLEYADKRVETVYAALTRQSTLSWQQVGKRFDRC